MIKSNLKWMAAALAFICWLPAQFASANLLINGSFEDLTADWTVTGFQRLNSITDKSGAMHLPTDGQWMRGAFISTLTPGGVLSQPFIFPAGTTAISFRR